MKDRIEINGEFYRKEKQEGQQRAVIVVDRGWIFAGDIEEQETKIILTDAILVFSWSSIGFDGMIANPKSEKVNLKQIDDIVEIPKTSEIFRVLVDENWGK